MNGESCLIFKERNMKKKLSFILVIALCLVLCACGKSKEAKAVDSMINAITTVDASALPAIREAKAALNALSIEDLSDVENGAKLDAMYQEIYTPLVVGQWVDLESSLGSIGYDPESALNPEPLTINADHTYVWNIYNENHQGKWEIYEDFLNLEDFYSLQLDVQDGKLAIRMSTNSDPMYTLEAYDALIADMVLAVEVTADNAGDYFAFVEYESEEYDDFNEPTGRVAKGFCLGNKLLEKGWMYLTSGDEFAVEVNYPKMKGKQFRDSEAKKVRYTYTQEGGSTSYTYCPFGSDYALRFSSRGNGEWDNYETDLTADKLSFGRAKGTIYFVKADYVDDVELKMEHGYYQRIMHVAGNPYEIYTGGGNVNMEY